MLRLLKFETVPYGCAISDDAYVVIGTLRGIRFIRVQMPWTRKFGWRYDRRDLGLLLNGRTRRAVLLWYRPHAPKGSRRFGADTLACVWGNPAVRIDDSDRRIQRALCEAGVR